MVFGAFSGLGRWWVPYGTAINTWMEGGHVCQAHCLRELTVGQVQIPACEIAWHWSVLQGEWQPVSAFPKPIHSGLRPAGTTPRRQWLQGRARRSCRRSCVLLAGMLAPLIGQIGLGAHSESAAAGSIAPSGRVAIRNMITTGYPADHIFYHRGGMQVWRLHGLTVIGGE